MLATISAKLQQGKLGHKNFEQICEPPIAHKSIDQVKANCADNDDDQNIYKQEKHELPPFRLTAVQTHDAVMPKKKAAL